MEVVGELAPVKGSDFPVGRLILEHWCAFPILEIYDLIPAPYQIDLAM